ncbi:MAG TPA: tripartite tricarboxylate transporter substrate binding protein [Bradyrhizobium sp.]|uniref:Bug family tripartite tricarboxylate transporter substrate binding protein n=1 Tax=Bradyrhizobium sp. TaxID=376 RepID=UPI002B72D148|nr:tripartite tricarboxylate transporter substrate binding protein [Bradyrhizobium sp.]HLZ02863.1 tripartite tricarboxylate transporter substrate binding protein [Bradyrhizobium sp.]
MRMRKLALALALVFFAGAPAGSAFADDYPSHPIRLIVPFAAGGAADAVARIVGKHVGQTLGQAVVVEDRGGGGGIIATELVKNAAPDGYTLLLGQSGPISINPGIYSKLSYDPEKDFIPITMTTSYPYVLVVNPSLGVKSVAELVALARSKPGELNYGTAGVGVSNHLVTELFDEKAGIKMTHVPYRGTSLAVADLIAGQVQVVFADPVSALSHVQAGTLLALAVTSKERSPVAPNVPTIAESGYPGFDAVAWHGIMAPAGTPQPIIDRLNAAIIKGLKDPETVKLIEAQAMQIVGSSQQDFASFIKQDVVLWKNVAREAKVEIK